MLIDNAWNEKEAVARRWCAGLQYLGIRLLGNLVRPQALNRFKRMGKRFNTIGIDAAHGLDHIDDAGNIFAGPCGPSGIKAKRRKTREIVDVGGLFRQVGTYCSSGAGRAR